MAMSHSPLLCLDPVLPLSLHCPGTTHKGLCTQPDGETDPAKRNLVLPLPPVFLGESVSVYRTVEEEFFAEKGSITLRDIHEGRIGSTFSQNCQPLSPTVLVFCIAFF